MKVVSRQILCERIVISHQFQRNLDLVSLLLLEVVIQTLVAFILLRIWGPFPASASAKSMGAPEPSGDLRSTGSTGSSKTNIGTSGN